jgi:lipopolysaccharide export system permease protein
MEDKSGMTVAATAEHGRFLLSRDDPNVILFRLTQGRLVQDSPKFATPRTLAFKTYDLPVRLPAIDQFRARGDNMDEALLHELVQWSYGLGKDHKLKIAARSNLHYRLVEIFMMLMLPFLAVALAVPPKRSSSSLGIFISLIMVVAYHKVNQYALQAGVHGRINPIIAIYVPLIIFCVLILWMYHVVAHRPGGQPIGALERGFSVITKRIRALLPKSQAA